MSVTIVSGVPGVGSSRVCELVRRRLDDSYELINFGDIMLEEAVSRGLATGRDEMATLPTPDYRILQRRAGEYIARQARGADLLVDSHFMLHTGHGFIPGFPEPVLRDVFPDMLVLVEADPGTIVDRRSGSDSRDYPEESEATVDFHQQLNRFAAVSYSMVSNAPIRTVSNEGEADAAAGTLTRMVETIDR